MTTRGALPGFGILFLSCLAVSLTAVPLCAHQFTPVRGRSPVTDFACQDTIAIHVAFDPKPTAPGSLVAEWHNINTDLHDTTRIEVKPRQPEAWVWMKYEPPAGRRLDPTSDGGYGAFAGNWTVNLFLNTRPIGATEFTVRC